VKWAIRKVGVSKSKKMVKLDFDHDDNYEPSQTETVASFYASDSQDVNMEDIDLE
jgi:hypothetical protein